MATKRLSKRELARNLQTVREEFRFSVECLNESPVLMAVLPEVKRRLGISKGTKEETRLDLALRDHLEEWTPSQTVGANGSFAWGQWAVEFKRRLDQILQDAKARALRGGIDSSRTREVEAAAEALRITVKADLAVPLRSPHPNALKTHSDLFWLWRSGHHSVEDRDVPWTEEEKQLFIRAIFAGLPVHAIPNALALIRGHKYRISWEEGPPRDPDPTRHPPALGGFREANWWYRRELDDLSVKEERARAQLGHAARDALKGCLPEEDVEAVVAKQCQELERAFSRRRKSARRRWASRSPLAQIDPEYPTLTPLHLSFKSLLRWCHEKMSPHVGKVPAASLLSELLKVFAPEWKRDVSDKDRKRHILDIVKTDRGRGRPRKSA